MASDILKRHPQTVVARIRPDGTARAFSIEEQWKQVADWHRFMQEADADPEYDSMDSYLEAWDAIEPLYDFHGRSLVSRGAELEKEAGSPLAALFAIIEWGNYPPPELLLALKDCWDTYMHNDGTMSLETAFLGKPVQKAGPYSQRTNARRRKAFIQLQFAREIQDGKTRDEAAIAVSEMIGGRLDVDSIKRMARMPLTGKRKVQK